MNNQYGADQYYAVSYTFLSPAKAFMDLLKVSIDYTARSNSISMTDNYEFWFSVFPDGTNVQTAKVKANTGKFAVVFPYEYDIQPTLAAVDDPTPVTFTAGLYQTSGMADYDVNTPFVTLDVASSNFTAD